MTDHGDFLPGDPAINDAWGPFTCIRWNSDLGRFEAAGRGVSAAVARQFAEHRAVMAKSREMGYRRDGNPLYAFDAILHALGANEEIPGWAKEYLAEAALEITKIRGKHAFGNISARQALTDTLCALGFSRQGKNAFVEERRDNDAAWIALDNDYAKGIERKEEFRAQLVGQWRNLSPSQVRRKRQRARDAGRSQD